MQATAEPPSGHRRRSEAVRITTVIFYQGSGQVSLPLQELNSRELEFLRSIVHRENETRTVTVDVFDGSVCDKLAHEFFSQREWATRLFLFKFSSSQELEIQFESP